MLAHLGANVMVNIFTDFLHAHSKISAIFLKTNFLINFYPLMAVICAKIENFISMFSAKNISKFITLVPWSWHRARRSWPPPECPGANFIETFLPKLADQTWECSRAMYTCLGKCFFVIAF
jgi:hypothetical protein